MIVDGHVHLWPEPRAGYVPVDAPNFAFPREIDGSAETLVRHMDAHGVSRAIVVQSPWWSHDDRYLIEAVERFPGRFSVTSCFPMYLKDADPAHEAVRVGRDGMAGTRLHVIGPDALEIFAGDRFEPLYRRLSEAGLPVLFLSRDPGAYPVYARIAAAFPDLRIVVEHMGFATTPPFGGTDETRATFLGLAQRPNIHVKLAVHHQHSEQDYPWADVFPWQQRIIGAFGAERCFWGSNWPMREPAYTERLETVSRHFPFKSEADRAWVLGKTAERLWPLSVPAGATL
jgi:predicted TIM-barrel fold metal-dependent hydrolase